ncbi:hypothetical protein [Teredinibacter franksiae]|uniref:hypothetical protein n=1 Tax=Teredinibacter franksiae TaxID=2761453 RepID=UPI00162AD13A|nr:hypothetical protein [Teredinibacter franksiae]
MTKFRLLISTLCLTLVSTQAFAKERIVVFPASTDFPAATSELNIVNQTLLAQLNTKDYKALPVTFTDPRSIELIDYLVDNTASESDKADVRREFVAQLKEQVNFTFAIFTSVINRPAKFKRGKIIWDDTRKHLVLSGSLKTQYRGDITEQLNQESMTGKGMKDADYNALSLKLDVYDSEGTLIEVKKIGIAVPYTFDTNRKQFRTKKTLFFEERDLEFLQKNIAKILEKL